MEPRLAAGGGDLAHLAGWAAKLAGATCRLAALLHLAGHLRDGWTQPISADTFAGAIRLADYLIDHARAVFDLMGADPRVDDARWLLDWIARTGRAQFSRRDAHQAARGPLPQGHRPGASPRPVGGARLAPPGRRRPGRAQGRPTRPPRGSSSTPCTHATEPTQPTKPHSPAGSVGSVGSVARGDTPGSPR